MALPTTIASTKFPGTNYYCGPFLSGGNVYVVLLDTTNSKIHVYKATDPTTSFTEQDSANVPAQTLANTANATLWALQTSTLIYIAAGDGTTTPAYTFHKFSMATDTWDATIKGKAILSPTLGGTNPTLSVTQDSSRFVVLLNGVPEKLMGSNFDRVSYVTSTDDGATWSSETTVGPAGTKITIQGSSSVLGALNRTHFFYTDLTGNVSYHRSLSSATLDTAANLGFGRNGQSNFPPGRSYLSGSNTLVKIGGGNTAGKFNNVWFVSAANPSITVDTNVSDATIKVSNTMKVLCYAVDGTTTHAVFSDNTTTDLMHDSQTDGGAWGTDVNEWAATINRISANIYTRSGSKVLAVLVDDGGTVKYNEIALSTDLSKALSGVSATG